MKKYEKPVLMFESYELSYNVANCSAALNHMEADTNCTIDGIDGIKFDGYTVFTEGSTCTYGPEIW